MNASFTAGNTHQTAATKQQSGVMTIESLNDQNQRFRGTGGVSEENRSIGFLPAFLDTRTGAVYLSRFADGQLAPMHLLDGLPPELVVERSVTGRVKAVSNSVTAGFVCHEYFYTREQATKVIMSL